jgi:leader peptidase (prepilin peptidase) / N-methyltransferase
MNFEMFIGISVTLLGLVMGSAVTALAWRVPRGESWVHGRSRCPGCGHVLGVLDLVPVLSWAVNLGRCRHCRASVSARYPLTEVACGLWALAAWRVTGLVPAFPLMALWGFLLVALFWIDLDFQLLPDVLTYPGMAIGLGAALLGAGAGHLSLLLMIAPGLGTSLPPAAGLALEALLGMAVGAGLLWLVRDFYFRVRKVEGMGLGDVKLAAMFGAVLGAPLAVFSIFLAALAGTVVSIVLMARGKADGKTALPFGTFLAPAAMVSFLWGDAFFRWYLGFLH